MNEVRWRATKFGESFTNSVGDVFPLINIIAKFTFIENDLANLLEMLLSRDCLDIHILIFC